MAVAAPKEPALERQLVPQSFPNRDGGLDLTLKKRLLQQLLNCCFKIKQIVVYLSFIFGREVCLWMLDSRGFVNVFRGIIWVFPYSSTASKAGECAVPRNQWFPF